MENEFGFPEIADGDLTLEHVPLPNEDWGTIAEFALSFDGYAYWGSSEKCAEIANARRQKSLADLRTCLFFEQRRHHHFGTPPDRESMAYIRDVVFKIRSMLGNREPAASLPHGNGLVPLSALLSPINVEHLDLEAVGRYRLQKDDRYRLHTEMGPSAFEGDVDNAAVVLLLGNPGFDGDSAPTDHSFSADGWPLPGLHSEAPTGLKKWWPQRLRQLTALVGEQAVSRKVAALQLTPWASERFDDTLRLPSRRVILEAANRLARKGVLLVVMRAERLWLEAGAVAKSENRIEVRSWRCSYVSEGNLGVEAWGRVVRAVSGNSTSTEGLR